MSVAVPILEQAGERRDGRVVLDASGLSKRFGGVRALDGFDFSLRAGEVHALLGPNGAGKSTFVKIISGAYAPDGGQLLLGGQPARLTPGAARAAGIETVHQSGALVSHLSVAENIALGRLPTRLQLVDRRRLRQQAAEALALLELDIDVNVSAGLLSLSDQRAVELARALHRDARILILDEPTAGLGVEESRQAIALVRRLADRGVGVVYVSHYLDEVLTVADRATVIRDGRMARSFVLRDNAVAPGELVRAMVGREIAELRPPAAHSTGPVALALVDVQVPGWTVPVQLKLRRGEVLGAFGMVGGGQSELCRLLGGVVTPREGTLELAAALLRLRSPRRALQAGVAHVPADRKRKGIVESIDVAENVCLSSRALRRGALSHRTDLRSTAAAWIARLGVEPRDTRTRVGTLSGGNQQKVLLAKALQCDVPIYVLEEPSIGLDPAARAQIAELVSGLAQRDAAVLVVSTDPEEVLSLCQRIVVFARGRIVAELRAGAADSHALVQAAAGVVGDA